MSAHVAAGGGDLRPSLRARASCKQIAPHEGSKQSSRPGRGPSQRSRRRGWQPSMYLPCGPLPTLQAKKSRIKSVKAALLVPRPSRVGEEQRGFGTFRNRLSPRRGKGVNPLPCPGWTDFSRSGKTAAEFAQEPSQFARMAPGPSRRRGRPALPTPRIWLTAGALLAVACQGGGERPLETSAGLRLDPWGLAEPPTAAARASEPVIAQSAVGLIRTSGAVPRAPGG